jgi:penicillin-binding protein 1C
VIGGMFVVPLSRLSRLRARARRSAVVFLVLATVAWIGWRSFRAAMGSPLSELDDLSWATSTRVLARDGRLLGERPSEVGLRGRAAKLDDMGDRLVMATVASEDRRFFDHDGVDRFAFARAVVTFVTHRRLVSGGSTISQQLVKRVDHHGKPRPRTVANKLREIARAQNLEAKVDKKTILEGYMNRLDYGRGFAGPEAAAQGYFGVHAKDLSLAQATFLAVLPRAPSALDPYRHRDRVVVRQRALLARMHADGLVSKDDLDRALAEPLELKDAHAPRPFVAPHVVLSSTRKTKTREVKTTLDLDLQRDVESLVKGHAQRLRDRGATNAAVVVVDATTGDVLAEVGSVDWADPSISGAVDLVRSRRQPGSTLKPFVYARAFERGVSPMEMLADVPTDFGTTGATYAPDNFDGTFVGPVSAREALAGSLNVPAVKLAAELGAGEVVSTLRASGLALPQGASRYGLSIALGSGEVTPLELAEAYTTLARGGEHVALRDRTNEERGAPTRVFDAAAVASIADALSDPIARIRGLRTRGPFELPFPTAVKTGTSTAYRDAWTAGWTHERVVVVWTGDAGGSATQKLTGAVGAGPLFFDVMKRAMRDVKDRAPLYDPSLLEEADVCPLSGHRAGPACTDQVHRRFPRGHAPAHTCNVHAFASPRVSARPDEPPFRCDASGTQRIVLLPSAFGRWLADRPLGAPGADVRGTPWVLAGTVPGCAAPSSEEPRIVVLEPKSGAVIPSDRTSGPSHDALDLAVETRGLPPEEPLEVVVDGRVAMRLASPYRARVPVTRGDHLVEVRPADAHRPALLGRASVSVR